MRPRTTVRAAMAATATAVATIAFAATGGAPAYAAAGTAPANSTLLPGHVFAPYWESYNGDNAATLSQQSGAKFLSAAFIQTASSGSCTAYWDGSTSMPIAQSTFGSEFSQIQSSGGNVIPSFGGYTADTTNTDIADSCTSVSSIAKVYENTITTYNVPRIDLDVEANSLTNTAGWTRRNQAVKMAEAWGRSTGHHVNFSFTMPVTPNGLTSGEDQILQNAVADGDHFILNIMTFDYYTGQTYEMAQQTETAAQGAFSELQSLYPSKTASQIWHMLGVTEMVGIDDFGAPETFTEADATTVLNWAKSKGIDMISFWAIERDNGGCPGVKGAGTCSGIVQPTWYFSQHFEPFTS
ncbi:MAG TPA: glycosyl hydrolase family 18 protein [Streptosporangiaceae bacterium]|nr:glycosyl hydrolase family 18 protein [Streptosporangiaceae bacterium]